MSCSLGLGAGAPSTGRAALRAADWRVPLACPAPACKVSSTTRRGRRCRCSRSSSNSRSSSRSSYNNNNSIWGEGARAG